MRGRVRICSRSAGLALCMAGVTAAYAQSATAPAGSTESMQGMDGAKKLMQQQVAWEFSSTPGAKLIAKERSRTKGEQGTVVRYDLVTEGLPHDQHYTLLFWPLNGPVKPVEGGISLTDDGRLICTGKTKADCAPSRPDANPVIDMALTAAKGEAKRFGVISDDQKWKALATVVAFPMIGADDGCSLEALRVTPDAQAVMIRGKGFPPNAVLAMTSDSAGEVATGSWQVSEKGDLISLVMPEVRGKTEGKTTVRVKAPACAPQVSFEWGKSSYHFE
ncbi:hypothetical protein [Edaphobacter aggregans]|uniref:hypothetical protein n=1 Tax=Edaphobacter aggregans TaxID=570835 RepID=UPI001B8089B5|nr:hypothetical protein [Edaphobacter aggregans]